MATWPYGLVGKVGVYKLASMKRSRDIDEVDTDKRLLTGSKENPIVICDSPMTRLTPAKHFIKTTTRDPSIVSRRARVKAVKQSSLTAGGGDEMKRVNRFKLYSHATDPTRDLKSVYAVAGTPKWTVSACTQEPNHNGGAQEDQEDKGTTVHTLSTQEDKGTTVHTLPIQEDKGTTAHTLSTQEDKGTTAHTLPTQEAVSITHHTNSLASNEPPDIAPVDIVIYPKPFHKFSQGYMETLTDVGLTNSDRLARYVQLLERLLAHAYFIPTNRIQIVVDTVLKVSNKQVLYRFHSLLCQDLKLRPSGTTNLPVDYLQDTLHTISHTLSFTPTHLPSRIVLHYIALLKPLLSSSLTTKLLDMAISTLCVPPLDSLPSPTQAALSLMASHSLPGDLAARIQQLTSYTDKHQLLRCIPQLDLRLKVVEVILSQSFHGDHDNQPTPNTSLEEICQRHFTRRPYRPNGDPHDLCYFLSLLLLLVETWLLLYHPPQCVGINHPPPETPPPSVQCVGHAVDLLTSRLLDDAFLTDELCSPNVWHQLQLLKAFSN